MLYALFGQSLQTRRSKNGTRVLSLTLDGQSTNDVMGLIRSDLVEGSEVGFPSIDAYGRSLRLFLDTLGFF